MKKTIEIFPTRLYTSFGVETSYEDYFDCITKWEFFQEENKCYRYHNSVGPAFIHHQIGIDSPDWCWDGLDIN